MRKLITIFLLIFLAFNVQAQQRLVRKAQLAINSGDYYGAIQSYEEAIAKGLELDESGNLELAGLYYALGQYDKSVDHYKSLVSIDNLSATEILHYSHALEIIGEKYLKEEVLFKLIDLHPSDSRVKRLTDTDLVRNRSLFNDYHGLLNSADNVIKVVEYQDVIYGIRLGDGHDELVGLNELVSDSLIFPDWNINQGGIAFVNPNHLIVTLNLNRNGKLIFYEDDRSSLHLYSLKKNKSGKWGQPEFLSINVDGYSSANPAIDPDGRYLYFASDRPGGMGQSDLYRVSITEDGDFGEVEHLSEEINTEGRESHVFIDCEGIMYFSSDGYPGKGGLDVYAINLNSKNINVFNMGHPINTVYDDFAYSRYGTKGYFSTNRDGYPATWSYDLIAPMPLTDRVTKAFDLKLPQEVKVYEPVQLRAKKEEKQSIETDSITITNVSKQKDEITAYIDDRLIELESILKIRVENINNSIETGFRISILFDHNSSYLNVVSKQNLKDLVTLLNQKKNASILIEGYADSTGENTYNNWLSERRTNRVLKFLINEDIRAKRINTSSYGEEKAVADNETEEGRQANRGVYITIFLNS